MRFTFLLFVLCVLTKFGYSQTPNRLIIFKVDGYMIDFSGQMMFQPCDDTAVSLLESLDGTSFNIWCNDITDRICESFDGLGDTTWIKYATAGDTIVRYGYMRYFHCTINIGLSIVGRNASQFKINDRPIYEIIEGNKRYPLLGFYVQGFLKDVIPTNRKLLLVIYEFYDKNNYSMPPLLEKTISELRIK